MANSNSIKKICPVCGGHRFITTAHVVQDWVVDTKGEFLEVVNDCTEVTHGPDTDNIWSCCNCGAEAVDEECFFQTSSIDLDDVVIKVHSEKDVKLCGKDLGKSCYIALWNSDTDVEDENCDSTVGYNVYRSRSHELVDGGFMEYCQEDERAEYCTDLIPMLLEFIFDDENPQPTMTWKLTNLDRFEDFEE